MKLRAFLYAAIIATIPAQAAMCGTHDSVTKALVNKYKESRVSVGVVDANRIVEVYASEKGGTWTILITSTAGFTCIIAAGKDWQGNKPEPAGMKA